jgi:hypothetical protein
MFAVVTQQHQGAAIDVVDPGVAAGSHDEHCLGDGIEDVRQGSGMGNPSRVGSGRVGYREIGRYQDVRDAARGCERPIGQRCVRHDPSR